MEEKPLRDSFEKDKDGNWCCTKATAVKGPRGLLQISQGMTFTKGIPFMGVDIGEMIERESS